MLFIDVARIFLLISSKEPNRGSNSSPLGKQKLNTSTNMTTIIHHSQTMQWFVFSAVAFAALAIDYFMSVGKELTLKPALRQSVFFVSISLAFSGYVYATRGYADAAMYLTGLGVEKALSVDNLFVMGLIFSSLGVRSTEQRKLLTWGIIGAIVFRGVFLVLGAAAVKQWAWLLYGLGGLLVVLGIKTYFSTDEDEEGDEPMMARKVKAWGLSPAIAALVAIEVTDVIFAIDSIPAILAISQDTYVVFTSNIFAILGLRALYFVLQAVKADFHYLPKALGIVLAFIGIKALLPIWHIHIDTALSLAVVGGLIFGSVILSLAYPKKDDEEEAQPEPVVGPDVKVVK